MKKIFLAVIAAAVIFVSAETLFAWGKEGAIPNTDIGYTDLSVSKKGVGVRLTNTSGDYVRVSLKLTFFDTNGNSIGYTVFGLREIPPNSSVDISDNYLSGKWKPCRDSARIDFSKMTYEPIYD
jgi:hypothetical protein